MPAPARALDTVRYEDEARFVELFRDEKVTHSAGVPTVWLTMIQHIEQTGEELGALQSVTIGGSAAPRAMIRWLRDRGIEVGHAWGMTETSPIASVCHLDADQLTLSDEDRQVRDWFKAQTEALGCTVTVDEVGGMLMERCDALSDACEDELTVTFRLEGDDDEAAARGQFRASLASSGYSRDDVRFRVLVEEP